MKPSKNLSTVSDPNLTIAETIKRRPGRLPTEEEKSALRAWLGHEMSDKATDEEMDHELSNAQIIVVIDDFTSQSPGYCGRLMLAVYAYPELYDLFTFNSDGSLESVPRDG